MQIFDEEPTDWKDLQDKVACVLELCGFNVETPKKIQTGRETIEVDVYAKNAEMTIICECKYWESRVPQSVALSFRTLVIDIGANKGIIIAKTGFQSGAYQSVKSTNIELMTWLEFENYYKEKILKIHIDWMWSLAIDFINHWNDPWIQNTLYNRLNDGEKEESKYINSKIKLIVKDIVSLRNSTYNEDEDELNKMDINKIDDTIVGFETKYRIQVASYLDFFEKISGIFRNLINNLEEIYGTELAQKF